MAAAPQSMQHLGLDDCFWAHCRVFVVHLLALPAVRLRTTDALVLEVPASGRRLARFAVCGVVVARRIDRTSTYVEYAVDDGTGIVKVFEWIAYKQQAMTFRAPFALGTAVYAAGVVEEFRGERALNCSCTNGTGAVRPVAGPNEECAHHRRAAALGSAHYATPPDPYP